MVNKWYEWTRPSSPQVADVLLGSLHNEMATVRENAARALGRVEAVQSAATPPVVNGLIHALDDDAANVCMASATHSER